MPVGPLLAAGSLVTSVFDSSGPDAKKYAERKFNVEALVNLAGQGNVAAWHYLGAFGKVAALPSDGLVVDGLKGGYGHAGKGWISAMGDVGYADIIAKAKATYISLAPKFALSGVSAAAAIAPPSTINPVTLSTTGAAPVGSGFSFGSMTPGQVVLVVVGLLVVLWAVARKG